MHRLTPVLCAATLLLTACAADTGGGDGDGGGDTTLATDTAGDAVDTADLGGGPDADSGTDTVLTCTDGDGDGFGDGCAAGPDCDDSDPLSNPGANERCGDERDNDCDDAIDEDCTCVPGATRACYDGPAATQGVGSCRDGEQVCDEGTWSDCQGQRLPTDEICDDDDNDCDGVVDDGVTNACGTCGEAPLEVCDDGLDNDCNGVIDDVTAGCFCAGRLEQPCYSGPPSTLGVGACHGGTFDCIEGEWGACTEEVLPTDELCDGVDNDCDGMVDEGVRNRCGVCGPAPAELCNDTDDDCDGVVDEGVRDTCGLCPGTAGEEVCGDGFDNDCNGVVDDGCPCLGEARCYPGPPETLGVGRCRAGTHSCAGFGEVWGPCEGYVLPGTEICDGVDNDCDGTTDLSPLGCSICSSDVEVCDGIDNDCDGVIDERLRNACGDCLEDVVPEETLGPEACDGVDNDCDGLIDEGLLNECGTCNDDDCGDCDFFVPGWSDTERCGDGQDNDNDGEADEDCPCTFGDTQPCFLGAPNGRRVGQCLDGVQSCINRDTPHWGSCEGGVLPSAEVCDGKDNDCNGCTDESFCDLTLACPVEDFIRPLRYYILDGGLVYDGSEGEATRWSWTIESPLGSSTSGAEEPNAEETRFYVDVSGDYRVTVTFWLEDSEFTCTWIVHAASDGLRVELTWNTQGPVDLDLHLHQPGNTNPWCTTSDCYYANCDDGDSPPWGYDDSTGEVCPEGVDVCRNPRLDIDNISLVDVPENINIDNPGDGDEFRVMVHYYGFRGSSEAPPTQPIVSIYCGGLLRSRLGEAPDVVELTDAGSRCRGDTWRVADVAMHIDPETGFTSCDVDVLGGGPGGWLIFNDTTAF